MKSLFRKQSKDRVRQEPENFIDLVITD